jgi:hypothetical protein
MILYTKPRKLQSGGDINWDWKRHLAWGTNGFNILSNLVTGLVESATPYHKNNIMTVGPGGVWDNLKNKYQEAASAPYTTPDEDVLWDAAGNIIDGAVTTATTTAALAGAPATIPAYLGWTYLGTQADALSDIEAEKEKEAKVKEGLQFFDGDQEQPEGQPAANTEETTTTTSQTSDNTTTTPENTENTTNNNQDLWTVQDAGGDRSNIAQHDYYLANRKVRDLKTNPLTDQDITSLFDIYTNI